MDYIFDMDYKSLFEEACGEFDNIGEMPCSYYAEFDCPMKDSRDCIVGNITCPGCWKLYFECKVNKKLKEA